MAVNLAAQVTSAGIVAPSFDDILNELKSQYQSIYGSDVYLGADSQDGQLLTVFAQAIHDSNQAAIKVFNDFSPSYAQGTALSSLVKINGLLRRAAGNSVATVTIVGQAGVVITNGQVQDTAGNIWALPSSITIPVSGTIDVTALCLEAGAIAAGAGTITKIYTPVAGWQSVTNVTAAVVGAPIETDADLRKRQAKSTTLPAQTPAESVLAAVSNLENVVRAAIYENDGDSADSNGIPAHSISVIVDGGDSDAIAATIAAKKTLGTGTYGSTGIDVADPAGYTSHIEFYQLAKQEIFVEFDLHPLAGWTNLTEDDIKQAISDFINSLDIGEDVYLSWVYGIAGLTGDPRSNTFKISNLQIGTTAVGVGTSDITIPFNEAASMSDLANVVINLV